MSVTRFATGLKAGKVKEREYNPNSPRHHLTPGILSNNMLLSKRRQEMSAF